MAETIFMETMDDTIESKVRRLGLASGPELFNSQRELGERDYVKWVYGHLKTSLGTDVAESFLANAIIADVEHKNSVAQRAIINKFFTQYFCALKTLVDTPILPITSKLKNDVSWVLWETVYVEVIIPMIKETGQWFNIQKEN